MARVDPPKEKRLPPEFRPVVHPDGSAEFRPLSIEDGLRLSWASVRAHLVAREVQTAPGMHAGATVSKVTFRCPRCEEVHEMHSALEHGSHPVKCFCDLDYVFTVTW